MTVETHICNSKAFIVLHKHADVAVPRFLKGLNLQQIPLIKKRKSALLQICQLHIHHIPKMQNYRVWWMCSSCLSLCYGAFVWQVSCTDFDFTLCVARRPVVRLLTFANWRIHCGRRTWVEDTSVRSCLFLPPFEWYSSTEDQRHTDIQREKSLQKPKHSKSLGFQFWLLLLL